jgi:hypothetical protein
MAITIQDSIDSHVPVWNDNWHIASSTNYTQDNFRYVFDLYVSGVTTPSYYRFLIDPNPSDSFGYFNPCAILRDFVSSDIYKANINPTAKSFTGANQLSYVGFYIKVGEQYGDSSGVTTYADLDTSANKYAWNGSWNTREIYNKLTGINYYDLDYFRAGGTAYPSWRWLTVVPETGLRVRSDEVGFMTYQNDTPSGVTSIEIKEYNSAGSLITTQTYSIPAANLSPTTNADNRIMFIASKPQSLSDASMALNASTVKYTIQALSASYEDSYTYTFYVNDECGRGDLVQLIWRNRWGGMESYSFVTMKKESVEVERSDYKRHISPVVNGYAQFAVPRTDAPIRSNHQPIHYTKLTDKFTINSNYVDDTYNDFFEDLLTSSEVYVYGTYAVKDILIPVRITNNALIKKRNRADGLVSYDFEFMYTDNRYRSRT